ncbi:MAG: A/G-specific adenine glycosylase [Pseudomonadota bacterium]
MLARSAMADSRAADLLDWYDRHARKLPWRLGPEATKAGQFQDPYKVWLSEIMLQQTTVVAVAPYFSKFVDRWPAVSDLAAASDDDVRKAWAGLGYYRRAANLHACAKVVAGRGGVFPTNAAELKNLPGIGDYTSAAIAAIAFGESVPVVDGNVERVITRLFRLDTPLPKVKRDVLERLADFGPSERPGDFAQAMMDLGATICTPKKPACVICPWRPGCQAAKAGDMETFPVKAPKKAKPRRLGAALVIIRPDDGAVWCESRPVDGLLPGMTQVPTSDWSSEKAPPYADAEPVGSIEHVFTHFALTLDVYRRESATPPATAGWWSTPEQLIEEAWPTVMVKVLKQALPELGRSIRPKAR